MRRGVQTALRNARALVFPSLWFEGQPLTVLEAKALGTPVIVSDVCAGREEVEDGVTGLWFRSGDSTDLARALRTIADDATVVRMSNASHEAYWADAPTLSRHVERIIDIYRGMLMRAGHMLTPREYSEQSHDMQAPLPHDEIMGSMMTVGSMETVGPLETMEPIGSMEKPMETMTAV